MEMYQRWLELAQQDEDIQEELREIEQKPEEIQDRFYRPLAFGTGGLRGVLGAGTNRMNIHVVGRASAGVAAWLLKNEPNPSVAIGYDTRIKSEIFAQHAAQTFAAMGVDVHLYSQPMPTPAVSFAVRQLGCQAGVVVTASHNPAQYNGYKVYGADGCQITQQAAEAITAEIEQLDYFQLPLAQPGGGQASVAEIGPGLYEAFYQAELAQRLENSRPPHLKIVYTPLHGAGLHPVCTVLERAGHEDVVLVENQTAPDGNFPTCPYPNPELQEALAEGLKVCRQVDADILLATDPDCDRVGVAVPHEKEYRVFSGNQVGVLLLDYICRRRSENQRMPKQPVAVKTIVTTPMADRVGAEFGVEIQNVLTGFKYIGEVIGRLEQRGEAERYIFGFEESCGYLSGVHVRDKDAVNACLLVADMAAYWKAAGLSLWQRIEQLYQQHGYFGESLVSYEFPGESGFFEMQEKMRQLRGAGLRQAGGEKVAKMLDYLAGGEDENGGLPSSDVVQLLFEGGSMVTVRPSGTEPKLKLYYSVSGEDAQAAEQTKQALNQFFDGWIQGGAELG